MSKLTNIGGILKHFQITLESSFIQAKVPKWATLSFIINSFLLKGYEVPPFEKACFWECTRDTLNLHIWAVWKSGHCVNTSKFFVLVLTNELLIMSINKPDEFLQDYIILCHHVITPMVRRRKRNWLVTSRSVLHSIFIAIIIHIPSNIFT